MSLDVEALYSTYHRPIRGYIARRMRGVDEAAIEDMVADVFERVVRAAPRFQERGVNPEAWLWRVAQNLLTDRYREKSRKVSIIRFGAMIEPSYTVRFEESEQRAVVRAAVDALSTKQRAVIVGRFYEGWRVADLTHIATEHGVKKLQQRALVNLKRALEAA